MSEESEVEVNSELDTALVRSLIAQGVELDVITKTLRPAKAPVVASKPPSNVAPAVITTEQRAALERLHAVYGSVVPETARELTEDEIRAISDEWEVIGEILALADKRKASIRTTVLNHHDTAFDRAVDRDDKGHVLQPGVIGVADKDKEFYWDIAEKGGGIDLELLQGVLNHRDWLSVTDPTRVLNGDKLMELLKKKPELAERLGETVTPGTVYGSLNYNKRRKADGL